MVQRMFACLILAADGERRAGNPVGAAHSARQAANERRLAAAKVADQLDNFAAAQMRANDFAQPLGGFGAVRRDIPRLHLTHYPCILPRMRISGKARTVYNKDMLQLSGSLLNRPVMSLRTGGPVAFVMAALINPHNLRIEGFYCADSKDGSQLVLLSQDVREVSRQGFIVDDHDVLAEPGDLVRLKDVIHLQFELLKKPVQTVSKANVGRVSDYAIESETMYIQKLYVAQSFWKSFTGGALSVDRSQITEVTNHRIVIQDPLQPTPSPASAALA